MPVAIIIRKAAEAYVSVLTGLNSVLFPQVRVIARLQRAGHHHFILSLAAAASNDRGLLTDTATAKRPGNCVLLENVEGARPVEGSRLVDIVQPILSRQSQRCKRG
jgi:hypothetical protein